MMAASVASSGGRADRKLKRKDQFNFTFTLMPSTLREPFQKDFPAYIEGMSKCKPGGFIVTPEFTKHAENIYHFQPRSDDVFVMTFPKCGTLSNLFQNSFCRSTESGNRFRSQKFNENSVAVGYFCDDLTDPKGRLIAATFKSRMGCKRISLAVKVTE